MLAAGIHTPQSCRLMPLPAAAAEGLLLHLDEAHELVAEMRSKGAENTWEMKRRGATAEELAGLAVSTANSKSASLVAGFIEVSTCMMHGHTTSGGAG